jgi:chromosome segregation ATPase
MEFEQIVKRLEWLDKQQRDNQDVLTTMDGRVASIETSVNAVSKQIKTLNKQISEILPMAKRVEQFEAILTRQRSEFSSIIEENVKSLTSNDREITKHVLTDVNELNKAFSNLNTTLNPAEVKKQLKERTDESQRLQNNINDLKFRVEEVVRKNDDTTHSLKSAEETRKNDLKRVADIQGEITALRKRIDESRDKSTLIADGLRNIENRFTDLLATELERKQSQAAFIEQQALAQIDRDRAWKDWKEKYDSFQKEAATLDTHIKSLDEAFSNAKKAQETYLDLNTKLERRINEVTEMQRLAEDRLRQEWVSFKTDDQKRWTGYTLSSEESFRDIRKDIQKAEVHATTMDDTLQVLQDQMHQTTDTTEKELQELMNIAHEWMTSYQRIMGHGKKTKK